MKKIFERIFLDSDSAFLQIEKRQNLLNYLAVVIAVISGFLMVASVKFIDKSNSVGHYALVCQAAKIIPENGISRIEIVRTFPLDNWLGIGPGENNNIIIIMAEVNSEKKYYVVAQSMKGVDLCLGELTPEYSTEVLSRTIEYEGKVLIIGEVLGGTQNRPPIFVETAYRIVKGGVTKEYQNMSTVYGKEVIISGPSNNVGKEFVEIQHICVIYEDVENRVRMFNNEKCNNSQDPDINIGLNLVIINGDYFGEK